MLPATSKCLSNMSTSRFYRCYHYYYYYHHHCPNPNKYVTLRLSRNTFQGLSEILYRPRNHRHFSSIKSPPLGVFWIWPFLSIVSHSFCNYQFLSTQASPSKETTEETLNQVLAAVENCPNSIDEICLPCITKLCDSGDLLAATAIVKSLRYKQIHVGSCVNNYLLTAASKQENFDLLCQTFKELLLSSESISTVSFLIVAKAFIIKDDVTLMLRFVRDVSDLTFPRNATVVNRIVSAFAVTGQVDKALLIFDQMKSLKCKPDLITYNTILGILGRCGRIDEMLEVFTAMEDANIVPDVVSFNTIINSLRKVGRLRLCLIHFKQMCQRGVRPDLRTYTAMIEIFGRSGNIEESLRLFDEMKCRQIRPSIYIYRSLINNVKKVGKLEVATKLLMEMNSSISNLVGPKDFKRKNR